MSKDRNIETNPDVPSVFAPHPPAFRPFDKLRVPPVGKQSGVRGGNGIGGAKTENRGGSTFASAQKRVVVGKRRHVRIGAFVSDRASAPRG